MQTTTVEKYHSGGRDFIVVIWDNGNGVLHEESFEVKKVSEREVGDATINEALTQAKQSIEIGVAARSI